MTENANPAAVEAAPAPARAPLDDVMIAMDVVDTIRQDKLIVERELNEDQRRTQLIERLREIYRGQGIEVPDAVLAEGVKALEEERFVYEPPRKTIYVKLARLYVSRWSWGQYVLGAIGAILALWIGWYALYEYPRVTSAAALRAELSQTIPNKLKTLEKEIRAETTIETVHNGAERLVRRGRAAALSENAPEARRAVAELERQLEELRLAYTIRVVSRKGELSGLWRVPKVNRRARNYYLVVEAVDKRGQVLERAVMNEETGKRERVRKWAVRVPRSVLERVRADKAEDGIIDNAVVALKERGRLGIDWQIETRGGAITQW